MQQPTHPREEPTMPAFEAIFAMSMSWLAANALALASAAVSLIAGVYLSRGAYRLILRLAARTRTMDRTFVPLIAQVARYGIFIFALVTALGFIGVPAASIYTVLGAAGLAVALALQNTLANIAAGIMLVWLRPIAVGEYIVGDGVAGVVVEIGLFATRLRSTSGLFIFTPNQKLWNSAITNHSREPRRRIDVNMTVPDSADIGVVRRAMLKVATADKRVEKDPAPSVHVDAFTGDKVVLQLRAWVATPTYLDTLRDITERAKLAVNRGLAAGGEKATAEVAADPHAALGGQQTPTLD
jgi:small conductance mechanosensitive channel